MFVYDSEDVWSFFQENMEKIKFWQESREFVYWEGETVEFLMQLAPFHLKLPTLYALCRE